MFDSINYVLQGNLTVIHTINWEGAELLIETETQNIISRLIIFNPEKNTCLVYEKYHKSYCKCSDMCSDGLIYICP